MAHIFCSACANKSFKNIILIGLLCLGAIDGDVDLFSIYSPEIVYTMKF